MKFRPCIDIHNGKVKQIIGGSLKDAGDQAKENFVAEQDAAFYAKLYKKAGLKGGHVILLNSVGSEYYGATWTKFHNSILPVRQKQAPDSFWNPGFPFICVFHFSDAMII